MITEELVKKIVQPREIHLHKGDCGRVLIGAGSVGMAGAAILASRGALRSGAGLVRAAVPSELTTILQVAVPEATCIDRGSLLTDVESADLAQYNAICIGPGLGEEAESIAFVKAMLTSYGGVLIVDADALNIIAHNDMLGMLRDRAEHWPDTTVITPHIGEARRLLAAATASAARSFDFSGAASEPARLDIAAALVEATRAIVVLKGSGTIVAAAGLEPLVNTTGNPGMATGGSGDVLAGIITGLAGQKRQPGTELAATASRIGTYDAAVAGVYIHGLAGDLAAADLGEYGLISGDLPHYVAKAIKRITE